MPLRFMLSEQIIIDLAHNDRVYKKGLSYYMAGRVINFTFSHAKRLVEASVIGGLKYDVQLAFDDDGSLRSYRCTCPAFTEYSGACKHAVAVMKAAQRRLPKAWPTTATQNQLFEDLLTAFAAPSPETPGEKLTLNIELYIFPRHRLSAHLQLKLGLQRLYVVKDIGQWLRSLKTGQSLEFGKQFTFEPARQSFREEDRAVIAMLQDMYDQHTSLAEIQGPYSATAALNTKSLPLTGYYLAKFLDALGDKVFLLGFDDSPLKSTQIIRDGLPVEFFLQTQDQNLTLTLNSDELPFLLTTDGNYFSYQQEIYKSTPTQKDLLPPIIAALHKGMTQHILIPAGQKELFASEALPRLRKLGQVSVDPLLETKFTYESLKAKLYFDRASDLGITARLEFHYGETVINPFASRQEKSTLTEDDLILIRSLEEERKILSILEQAEFMVSRDGLHLEDDEKIFDFTFKWLPQLQNLAELYYSDQFKLKLRTQATFSGQVRLNETLDILEVSFQYADIPADELVSIFDSLKLKKKYHRLRDGSFLDLTQQEFTAVAELFHNLSLDSGNLNDNLISLPKYRAFYIDSFLRQTNLPGLHRNKAFKQLVQSILEPKKLVPADQAWYWTKEWQTAEREVREDYAAGRYKTFENADDFVKDLISSDRNED